PSLGAGLLPVLFRRSPHVLEESVCVLRLPPGFPAVPHYRLHSTRCRRRTGEVGGQASGMPTTPTPPSRTGQDPFSVIRLSRSPGSHASVRVVVRSDDFSKSTHADGEPTPCGPSPCPPHYR